jgi:hypothetical protein
MMTWRGQQLLGCFAYVKDAVSTFAFRQISFCGHRYGLDSASSIREGCVVGREICLRSVLQSDSDGKGPEALKHFICLRLIVLPRA